MKLLLIVSLEQFLQEKIQTQNVGEVVSRRVTLRALLKMFFFYSELFLLTGILKVISKLFLLFSQKKINVKVTRVKIRFTYEIFKDMAEVKV